MINKLKSLLIGSSFAPKINYPIYFVLKDGFWISLPLVSRIMRYFCYHSLSFRQRFCKQIVNERIVEVPLIIQNVTKPGAQVLDVGCDESPLSLHLASLGHKVTALDLNNYEFEHPNIHFVKGDITKINLPPQSFDYVIFLSTIEHVGLGAYGEHGFGRGDEQALKKAKEFLKPDGRIIISCPFGRGGETSTQRIYDPASISRLFSGFTIELQRYFKGLGQQYWLEVSQADLASVASDKFTQGMGFFVLKV